MRKAFLLLFLTASLFALEGAPAFVKELLLLNNPLLNSGHYRYNPSYTIDNYSLGREFQLNKHFETSLYLSYSNSKQNREAEHFFGLKSGLGFHNSYSQDINYSFGITSLFLQDHKMSNITTIYTKIKYQKKSSYNPYLEAKLQYNIFSLPYGYAAHDGFNAILGGGLKTDIFQKYTSFPLTINPYVEMVLYNHTLKKELDFTQLYTLGLGFGYNIGEYFQKNSLFHTAKIEFNTQKTLSNSNFRGYNLGFKISLFDF